jgi:cytochrome c oxidase cbb3-type subunit III
MATMAAGRRLSRFTLVLMAVGAALAVSLCGWLRFRERTAELLRRDPDQILADPRMLRFAARIAQPIYQQKCAGCHGRGFQGDPRRGVPDLAMNDWLYGNNAVDVEHTILYGVRSGHPRARNLADMPALVRTGQLTPADAWDVVEYLQSLAGAQHDEEASLRGRSIYYGKGNCYDCHANDARGVTDYGTPALTGPVYLYGGDRQTLYQSILNGRHGECPAWVNVLSPAQIRALALYLVTATRASVAH